MSAVPEKSADLKTALSHTAKLLESSPSRAAAQANEILRVHPNQANALMFLALAHEKLGNLLDSLKILSTLCTQQPKWAAAHYSYGLALARAGQGDQAVASLKRTLSLMPTLGKAWLSLANLYSGMGDAVSADLAYGRYLQHSADNPRLMAAAAAMVENRIPEAERALKDYLHEVPTDVAAIRMLAEIAARLGRDLDAENLLARCLELAPGFQFARQNYAYVLNRSNKFEQALQQAEILLKSSPGNLSYRNLKAVALSKIGDCDNAIKLYEEVLAENPGYSKIWHSFGHTLKTAALLERAIAAYRKSIELEPAFGEAYWSLANLKTFRFTEQDVTEMHRQLASDQLTDEERFHFDFALGKALEDRKAFAESFRHYDQGNALRRTLIDYSPKRNALKVRVSKKLFGAEFFRERAGFGDSSADPIFILGMPRAGSTLLEQILSSHSQVEGTMELPDIIAITKDLYRRSTDPEAKTYYPMLAGMDREQAEVYGRRYLDNTRIHRRSAAPFFIDKMPNNFAHIALIQLILPNARIIDARRHPLACCFSNFKQHFARGQNFSYTLNDMGRFYADYVELMAHYDRVLPGRIHRVHYENMVQDTEAEVRRLLDYCGLPFEESCLRFFENDRPVRTASSEQVRQPIYTDGVEHWRHYEEWLQPLKDALGPVLDAYPEVPEYQLSGITKGESDVQEK
jgi:tetratricopeptide (TPR) repeat protein